MRFKLQHGVIEVGSILYSPAPSENNSSTEGMYLMARHVLEALGYRRYEWKCNVLNAACRFPSNHSHELSIWRVRSRS